MSCLAVSVSNRSGLSAVSSGHKALNVTQTPKVLTPSPILVYEAS